MESNSHFQNAVALATVIAWNENIEVGTRAICIGDFGEKTETRIASKAWVIPMGEEKMPLVTVECHPGGYRLDRVIPIPE